MNDTQEPTAGQKSAWIVDALEIIGFERVGEMDIFKQEHGMKTTVVDLSAGVSIYFKKGTEIIREDDEHQTIANIKQIIDEAADGRMPVKVEPDIVVPATQPDAPEEPRPETPNPDYVPQPDAPDPVARSIEAPSAAIQTYVPPELTIDSIKKYINDKATDQEAYWFLQLCQARGLNPFLNDAYLIKYDHNKAATMIVGKDAIMKRAELHPMFEGFKAGIIVAIGEDHNMMDEREGCFYTPDEKPYIIGGWAEVHRKDRLFPTTAKVALAEYVGMKRGGEVNKMWSSKPGTMIRKVAIVQALRETFTSELGGCYDQCEMGIEEVFE